MRIWRGEGFESMNMMEGGGREGRQVEEERKRRGAVLIDWRRFSHRRNLERRV